MKWLGTVALAALLLAPAAFGQTHETLKLVQSIPMPGVTGRLDHLSIDVEGQRLFVSALGNNTVEVIDLAAGRVSKHIGGLHEPQGVLYVPESDKLFVANGGDGTVRIFDGGSYDQLASVHFPSDADDIRYDDNAGLVYVGYGEGGLGVLNALTGKELGRIGLPGHPEAFEVEKEGNLIYVNVPTQQEIDVVDRTERTVVRRWSLAGYRDNFPMAFDRIHHLLFVACRRPSELLALDPDSEKILAQLPVAGDADDLYYDPAQRQLYVSGGEGFISVVAQTDAEHYHLLASVPTTPGARTSLFAPDLKRFYVAVPSHGGHAAEIRVYAVE